MKQLILGVGMLVLFARPAQAQYLDPGAGSTLIQVVIAVAVGLAATTRLYWRRVSSFLSRFRKPSGDR